MRTCFSVFAALRAIALVTLVLALVGPLPAQQSAPVLVTQAVDDAVRTSLPGNVHPLARAEFDRGEAPADLTLKRILLVLKRSPEQEAALRSLIDNQQDKNSPNYHRWVTPEEFGARFGPADSDIAAVTNWLTASGFEVTQVSRGRTVIEFSGTAGVVKQVFRTAIHKFVFEGEEHWANVNDPAIPTALAPVVTGVNSLHNFEKKAQNKFLGTYSQESKQLSSPAPNFTFNGGCTPPIGNCYALVPYDFATIYDLLPLWNAATPINGTGQTIAIVGRTAIDQTDPPTFWNLFGLDGVHAPQPTLVITPNGPMPDINGDEPEADIDIQWSGAAAPGATINFVTSASTETTDGVDLSALYIVDNNVAPVMSESYALCELGLGQGGVDFYGLLWEQAAAQGITAMVSTGDNGAAGCDNPGTPAQFGLNVNGLASTPFNVAVGGTDFAQFTTDPTTYWNQTNAPITQQSVKGYIPETTWNDSCANPLFQFIQGGTTNAETNCNNPSFSGFLDSAGGSGGKSLAWLKPSWQTGTPADSARDLPDISLFSSDGFLGSFYVICVKHLTGGVCDLNSFAGFGGTSVASPAFAGIMALVNQKWGVQGNPNFVLYKLPAKQANAFHDVPSGTTIAMPCFKGTTNCTTQNPAHQFGVLAGFNTATAYDLATGLGSVDVANMVNNWNKVTFTATTTTLTLNSGNPVTVTHGAAIPITVSVSPTSASGDVALLVSPGTPGDPGIDFNTLGSGGAVTWSTNLLPGGTYKVIAHYEGDTIRGGSYSAPSGNVIVNPENSSVFMPGVVTATDGNGNPVYSTSVAYASFYLLRADVRNSQENYCNPPPLGQIACPSGNVALTDNGTPLDDGSYVLNSLGYTEDQIIQLAGGTHTLKAQYQGDSSYNPSSASVQVTVTPVSTSMANISLFNAVVGYQLNASDYVNTNSSGVAPSGTVTFFANGTPMIGPVTYTPYNGGPNRGSASLNASISTTTSPFPAPGTYTITASYSGDANYTASTAPGQTINVKFPQPGLSLQSSGYTVAPGTTLTFTATVFSTSPTIAPTGTLTISSGTYGQLPGTPTYKTFVDQNGNMDLEATLTYTISVSDNFTVAYSGDSNYPNAFTGSGLITVTGSDFNLTFTQTTLNVVPGQGAGVNLIVGMQSGADPVTFSAAPCTGLPAESTCTTSPSSVTYTSAVQFSVATTAPHHVAANQPVSNGTPVLWAMSLGLGFGGIFLIGGAQRKNVLRAIALCAFLTFGFGCGGGGGGGGGGDGGHTDPGTPPGNYTITIMATSGSTSHAATITLLVQ